jgi:hypothetical protein
MFQTSTKLCLVGAFAAVAGVAAQDADARGPRGGGFRGGAGISRAAGGGFNRANVTRPQRGTGQQRQQFGSRARNGNTGATANANSSRRANGNSNTQLASRGNGNTGIAGNSGAMNSGNAANSGVVGSGNGNTGVVNNGNVNNGNIGSGNVNTGNVVAGNDVDIDVNGGWVGYPAGTGAAYATGVVVGSTVTAAAIGSYYSALPVGCSPYVYSSYRYYTCAGTWYQEQYRSGTSVYVVVADPTKGK